MDKLIDDITDKITREDSRLSLVYCADKFLYRKDIQETLMQMKNIHCISGDSLSLRIHFETVFKYNTGRFCYLLQNDQVLLEDIQQVAHTTAFRLKDLFIEYNVEPLLVAELWQLTELYRNKPIVNLSKNETQYKIDSISCGVKDDPAAYITEVKRIDSISDAKRACSVLAKNMLASFKNDNLKDILPDNIDRANTLFQTFLKKQYWADIIPSSHIISPKVVTKILPYISSNYSTRDKIALVVIDGMSYWQYLCLAEQLRKLNSLDIVEDAIFSWIPSITTLSRQAIFRGSNPLNDYKQSPQNESKLWSSYWSNKGMSNSEIAYYYDELPEISSTIKRLAFVTTELDEKMHASDDYNDLFALTNSWTRKDIAIQINKIIKAGFTIFLTADHGNVQTKAWRSLTQIEKVGTKDTGSRSSRHIEYSDNWSKEQFIGNNQDIAPYLFVRNNTLSITNEWSFTNKSCISHGGSHILEVLVPFITIKQSNE